MINETHQIAYARVAIIVPETGERIKVDYLFNADVTYNVFCIMKRLPHDRDFIKLKAKAAQYTLVKDGSDISEVRGPLNTLIKNGDNLWLRDKSLL